MIKYIIAIFFTYSANAQTIINDTIMNGVFDGQGKTVTIYGKISGNVTITNCDIIASPYREIFDTTVSIGGGVNIKEFSAAWFGAKTENADNTAIIQKAINNCINRYPLFIPKGVYNLAMPLKVSAIYNGTYVGCTLKMYGESPFWGSQLGTTLNYLNTQGMALMLQLNKGSEISNLRIRGNFISPSGTDLQYFPISFENYKPSTASEWQAGIGVDPDRNQNGSNSGSTGIYFHDLDVSGFTTLFSISQNEIVRNGDNLIFERIQLGDGRVGFDCGNAQAKGNVIRDCFGWGSLHTAFRFGKTGAYQTGSWFIDNNSFAGRVIRPFDIAGGSWFAVTVNKLFCERIYTIGNFYSTLPCSISNSTFDFAYKSVAGERELMNVGYNKTVFRDCSFRYYGNSDTLKIIAKATFENCTWSGVKQYTANSSLHINYEPGTFNISNK